MKIKCIYVDHELEEFAILNAAQAMDFMFGNVGDIETDGDHTGGAFYLDLDSRRIEFFRNNEYVEFQEYYERLKDLENARYTNVTNSFHMVLG